MVSPRMKAVQFSQFGVPHEVTTVAEQAEPGAPAAGQVAVDFLCSPINPADLLLLSGLYGQLPPLPAIAGLEGVGRVTALGSGVDHLKIGDRVLLPGQCWRERMVIPAGGAFALPSAASSEQLAMLTVNPPTAWALLHEFVAPEAGSWVIQNAANSGVGTSVIVLAKHLGLRSIAVVRRDELVGPLRQLGADVVLVDGPDLAARARAAIAGGRLRLGIDAIGGEATARIAACLDDGGVAVNYGLMSGQNCQVSGLETVFRDVSLRGFWIANWFKRHPPSEVGRVFGELARLISEGTIAVPIAARYPLSRVREALVHAAREARGGKILLVPEAG